MRVEGVETLKTTHQFDKREVCYDSAVHFRSNNIKVHSARRLGADLTKRTENKT